MSLLRELFLHWFGMDLQKKRFLISWLSLLLLEYILDIDPLILDRKFFIVSTPISPDYHIICFVYTLFMLNMTIDSGNSRVSFQHAEKFRPEEKLGLL